MNPTSTSATHAPSQDKPLHIVEIETFDRGGLTHYSFNLSCALAERGHRVTLVSAAGFELADRGLPPGVEVVQHIARLGHRLDGRLPSVVASLLRKGEALFDSRSVARLVRRLNPDVVHLHCTNSIVLFHLQALQRLDAALVSTAHVVTPHERMRFQDAFYRRVHGLGDLIIAHSEHDRRRLLSEFAVDPGRTTVIPHGEYGFFERAAREGAPLDRAAARRRFGLSEDDEVVLFFGYIREYKGLDVLYDAWPSVTFRRPSARLLVAGDPVQLPTERRQALRQQGESLGAVQHFGYIPFEDVRQYFAAADLLVMPYRHISQSGVLFLALSLGVPVVASRVGGLPEMLDDGDSALLVPPEDPSALADALSRALGDVELRQRLSEGARRVTEDHTWPSIAERTEAAFRGLVSQR